MKELKLIKIIKFVSGLLIVQCESGNTTFPKVNYGIESINIKEMYVTTSGNYKLKINENDIKLIGFTLSKYGE